MHEELIDELNSFALQHNLHFHCHFDEQLRLYYFTFQNQERTWEYGRQISQEQLDLFNGPTVYFARDIINTLKRKVQLF